jgi:hypothetical protein
MKLIAPTLLALLSIAAAENPDGILVVDKTGGLNYFTTEEAAALNESWGGKVSYEDNFFGKPTSQNPDSRNGEIPLEPQSDPSGVSNSAPTENFVRKTQPPCGSRERLPGARERGGSAGRARVRGGVGCGAGGRNLRGRAPIQTESQEVAQSN